MEDRTVEILSENCECFDSNRDLKPSSPSASVQTLEDSTIHSEQIEENTDSIDDNSLSSGIQETTPDQGHTLPILQKIIDLSTKVQNLKKEHTVLSDQVKQTTDSFPGPEVVNTLQLLNTEHELLKKKYLQESSERKRLYNEVIELKGNIRVFCRCRPLNQNEITSGSTSIVDFDSSQDNELQVICSDSSKKQFKFDHVFRPEDNQEAVFAQTKPIVTSVLDGYNVCIFAYGQTGTGKTFTMEGTLENRGVNYRTLEELFRISDERGGIMRYELFVSMLEVYNEKIRDLLIDNSNQPAKKLEIKQAAEGTQEVPGLVEAHVYSTEDVWELMKSGSRSRSVGSTNANELSSRSHCLLRVTVKGENLINGQKIRSHLWLVDLAGSERVGRIEVEGERLKESQFINKSLSALGDVIYALASKTAHIPYRNSKLTHMLQSSLGGDCKTLMFVQISPNSADLGETLCSLNFASRVRGIESGPARKQADLSELFKYKQMAEKLKHDEKETKKLQDNLQSMQLKLSAREHICRNLQEKVRDLENQLAEERKTRLKQETRAFAAATAQPSGFSSLKQAALKTITEKKPPLAPSKVRLPLRRISNFLPPPSPVPPRKAGTANPLIPASAGGKENIPKTTMAATNTKNLMKPRRFSVAVRPHPSTTTTQAIQPRRRVSIATIRPESNTYMTTPLHSSASQFKNGTAMGRQSFVRDSRKARYSRLFSPMPELRTAGETTPTAAMRSSSKFMGSPPTQAGSWKSKHPTVVALQRKPLVWSPLKLRGMKNNRRPSLLPSL
ncbi:hypothetical protein RGQ29_014132 [Quercus rubra]|uniref:Kinesin-like protein n=1 Tax=Quercus rubra TaxID=3512 RepID=A0AAN7FLD0_QUERU|nr:hypothetical protein RGQ29_014132 [Quercus rubra]